MAIAIPRSCATRLIPRTMLRYTLSAVVLIGTLAACGQQEPEQAEPDLSCLPVERLGAVIDVAGGEFLMGASPAYPEEGPPREIVVAPFRIDAHEVTNTQYAEFVEATGYITEAERAPDNVDQLPEEFRAPGSAVFVEPSAEDSRWWRWQPGAHWRAPEGPGSDLQGRATHPVVHISLPDAEAYAAWKGGTLPTEAQWEYAARAGDPTSQPPTNEDGLIEANHYQGAFPARDLGSDGFIGTAPVGCFSTNAFGLSDMIGNVWEWTLTSGGTNTAIIKGGSFLCADSYCRRYRPSARQFQETDLGTSHVGFRLVYPATE